MCHGLYAWLEFSAGFTLFTFVRTTMISIFIRIKYDAMIVYIVRRHQHNWTVRSLTWRTIRHNKPMVPTYAGFMRMRNIKVGPACFRYIFPPRWKR